MNLALNNLQWLICHKTETKQTDAPLNTFHIKNLKNTINILIFEPSNSLCIDL